MTRDEMKCLISVGGLEALNIIRYCGILEVNEDFTEFKRYGRIHHLTPGGKTNSVPLFENQIVELSDGSISMLMRGDLTNRLWRSDSPDGGRTWGDPVKTDILNPGSKPLVINLPDGRIVLFNNPSEKDNDDLKAGLHDYRTPLEMWISDDDMKTWSVKESIDAGNGVAQYPDGFYDKKTDTIYITWENDREVFFKKIKI